MTNSGKFYYDLHVHTNRYSPCSTLSPEQSVREARARGLHGIALTEHGHCWRPDEVEQLKQACGCPSYPILVGCEILTRSEEDSATGELLVFGLTEPPPAPLSIDALCRYVHDRNGAVIAPHPFSETVGIGEEVYSSKIDALEVHNRRHHGPNEELLAKQAWQQRTLAGLASSDAHGRGEVGRYCTEFDFPIENERTLIEAIATRQCTPRRKPPPFNLLRALRLK